MGIGKVKRAVFLDRDGVLNLVVRRGAGIASPRTLDEFQLTPGAADQVQRLKQAGFLTIVVTNQPDLSRGLLEPSHLERMHAHLSSCTRVDEILTCPHDDGDGCACRKPKPGLILDAAHRHGVDLGRSFMVGDSWKDMGAAKAAGVLGILIDTVYNQDVDCDCRVKSLQAACGYIISNQCG
ncbi:MAG: HAD family hydrolase [Desulfarculaceae bacterium]